MSKTMGSKEPKGGTTASMRLTPRKSTQEDVDYFESMPYDTVRQVALHLPPKEISKLCVQSKKLAQLCRDQTFWKMKYINDYPLYVPRNLQVEVDYRSLHQYTELLMNNLKLLKFSTFDPAALINEGRTSISLVYPIRVGAEINISTHLERKVLTYFSDLVLTSLGRNDSYMLTLSVRTTLNGPLPDLSQWGEPDPTNRPGGLAIRRIVPAAQAAELLAYAQSQGFMTFEASIFPREEDLPLIRKLLHIVYEQ